jgi:hypothetical protein
VTLGDVAGDDGPDNETFPADIEAIQGTDFDDTLTMGPTSKEAYGQGGNDTITGNAITEVIYGGDGDDVIRGGDGGEELYGDAGDDLINGGGGTDEIQGGDGNDILEPIELVGIWDTVHGGAGDDWVYMTGAVGPVTVTLGEGVNGDGPDDEDYGADIENVRGTEFDDDLLGGGIIDGGGGADTLRARDGATLIGGPGIDSYVQASGTSHTVSYAKDTTGITMNGASVTVDGGTETLPATALIVIGSPFADTMTGRAAIVDTLKGGDGNDTIELRDGTVDGVADCGAGTDSIRSDTGTVTDPDPIGCESGNPVVPPAADPGGDTGGGGTGTGGGGGGTTAEPTPVTARLTGVTSSVERYRCPRSQQSRGVKVGRAFWCLRLTVRGRVLDSAHDDAAIAGQLVGAFRVSGQKLSKLGEGSTSATGAFVVRRAVTVPARYRRTLAQASSYAARQHQRVHVLHTVRGEVVAATALRVRTLEPSRLVRTSSRLGRYACRAREQRLGVREGAMRWCYWLSVRSTLRRSIDNAPLARQRVNVYRVVGQRQRLLGSTRSDRRGNVLLVQTVIVPAAHRSSTAKANRWLAAQYRTTRLRHFAAGSSTTGSAPVVNLRTRR